MHASRRNVTLSHGTRIQAKRNPKPWHTRSQAKRNPMACTQPGGRNPKATTCTQPDERNPKALACTQPDERNPQAMASIGARRSRREPLCRRGGGPKSYFSSCLVKMVWWRRIYYEWVFEKPNTFGTWGPDSIRVRDQYLGARRIQKIIEV